jgi:hypothetical protein
MTVQFCPACQRPLPRLRVMCACGHPETSHDITRTGARTWCAHYAPAGACRCDKFTHVPATGGAAQEGTT